VTPEKQRQKLAGQSAIAQKIFDCVPIKQGWISHQIAAEVRRLTGTSPEIRTVVGCLNKLVDAGLVRHLHGEYRREPVGAAAPIKKKEQEPMAEKKPTSAAPGSISVLELLGAMSEKLRGFANELDAIAVQIEDEQSVNAKLADRYKQVQALLGTPVQG
jgi:hypothetical protein